MLCPLTIISSALIFCRYVSAVYEDDVAYVDWKVSLLGIPKAVASNGSWLAVLSDKDTVGVIDHEGRTVWSHLLDGSKSVALDRNALYVSGDQLSVFEFNSGELLYSLDKKTDCLNIRNGVVHVDGYEISNRELIETEFTASCSEISSPVTLGLGETLSWESTGVLTYHNVHDKIEWVREEGLAYADEAMFVNSELLNQGDTKYLEYINALKENKLSSFQAWATRLGMNTNRFIDSLKYLFSNFLTVLFLPEPPKQEFGLDQILVVKTMKGSIYALNTTDKGSIMWVYHDLEPVRLTRNTNISQMCVISKDDTVYTLSYDGDIISTSSLKEYTPQANSTESIIATIEINDTTLHSRRYGWSVKLPGKKVIDVAYRDPADATASITVPTKNNDVLYKFLNPYAAAIASYEGTDLIVTLIDTLSGRILSQATHPDPVIINEQYPFKMIYGEHWIAYTYLSLDKSMSYKISVWDLFETDQQNTRISKTEVIALQDSLVPYVQRRTWNMPFGNEPVYDLATSKTLYGASSRDIIFSREHRIESLPKYWLSTTGSTPNDIVYPEGSLISHRNEVEKASLIVTGASGLESTYLLSALGGKDIFFTRITPSGEYDRIARTFPKLTLVGFMIALVFGSVTISPFVRNRTLRVQWR